MPHLLLILFLALLFRPLTTLAADSYTFHTVSVRHGVSGQYVNSILRDHNGMLWIGTSAGLNSFDGYRVRSYVTANGAAPQVRRLATDGRGNLWVQTFDSIYVMPLPLSPSPQQNTQQNTQHPTLQTPTHAPLKLRALSDERTTRAGVGEALLTEMGVGPVRHLTAARDGVLFLWNDTLLYICTPTAARSVTVGEPLADVCQAPDGSVSLVTEKGRVARIDTYGTLTWLPFTAPATGLLRIKADNANRLWLWSLYGTYLSCHDTSLRDITVEMRNLLGDTGGVTDIATDSEGNLWVATNNNGVVILDRNNLRHTLRSDINNPFSLPSNHINHLLLSDDGMVWVATTKAGIAYTTLNQMPIRLCRTTCDEDIACIRQIGENILLGYDGMGMRVLPFDNFSTSLPADNLPPDALVVGIFENSILGYYVCTYGDGIFIAGADHKPYPIEVSDEAVREDLRHVWKVLEDADGRLWVVTFNRGLHCLQRTDGVSFIHLCAFTMANSPLRTDCVTDVSLSRNGKILTVATTTGLYNIHLSELSIGETGNASAIETIETTGNASAIETIDDELMASCLLRDRQQLLWVGTMHGLLAYDPQGRLVADFTTADGLSHDRILALAEDLSGSVWATTNNGVTRVVRQHDGTMRAVPYYSHDGLGDIVFCEHSACCTTDGRILAGGKGCFAEINPIGYQPRRLSANVYFTSVIIDGTEVTDVCEQLPVRRSVTFEVSDLNFRGASGTRYLYRLDDGDWKEASANQIALGTLPPASYTLSVRVLGDEADTPVTVIRFRVGSLWQHWAVMPCLSILLLLACGVAVALIIKRLRRKPYAVTATHTEVETPDAQILSRAAALVEENMANADFSVEQLAQELGMSRSNLFRRIKSLTGQTPLEFIQNIRLQRAHQLISQGSMPIAQAAYAVG
ncbi:MAG: helix-turn-helix domain-containing protein, partial [Bacteroidaceae bacterium]|nr:helix-turn-helix domain-containing protein [Bacteroidaceae bacterium]